MTRIVSLIATLGPLCALPRTLPAQGPAADSSVVQAAMATLRSDLRNFVVAQEAYFADHVTYAASLRQLQSYRASRGVTVVILTSSDSSHSEIAITDKVPGLVCAMFVGNGPKPFGVGKEAAPACHTP